VISYVELLRTTQDLINVTFRPIELYTIAALYYLTLTTAWNGVQRIIERFYGRGVLVSEPIRPALERV
jgi:polar amino acid transport system permease protein